MKHAFRLFLAILITISLAACRDTSKDENVGPFIAGGSLVIYTPNSDPLIEVAKLFGEKYGVEIEIYEASTSDCLQRIEDEKDDPQGDVMYGGIDYSTSFDPDYYPLFEPYLAAGDDDLPEAYQNFNGITTHYCLDGSAALLINVKEYEKTGLKADDFDSYADLLQPELAGKIAMGDPATSSSAWAELTNMLRVMGDEPYDDKAWQFVEAFIKNLRGVKISSSSAVYNDVVEGKYAVGVSYEDPCINLIINGAEDLKLVYPSEGAVWLPAGAAIIKGSKNIDNARLFLDWLISKEGQQAIGETTARPVNPDILNSSKEIIPFSKINVVYEDMALCGENKQIWQDKWVELFNKIQ